MAIFMAVAAVLRCIGLRCGRQEEPGGEARPGADRASGEDATPVSPAITQVRAVIAAANSAGHSSGVKWPAPGR